jgi:hypothetical protein
LQLASDLHSPHFRPPCPPLNQLPKKNKPLETKKAHILSELANVAQEQAALPYKWAQTLEYVDILVPVPEGTRARDLAVTFKAKKISIGLKNQEPILSVSLAIIQLT